MDNNEKESQAQQLSVKKDEVGFPYVDAVPGNAFKCVHWLEFYRLRPLKRRHSSANIEINSECMYLVKATLSDRYYIRDIWELTEPRKLHDLIQQGRIWLMYNEDVAESIRKNVESSGLSYYKFLQRAVEAMREEEIDGQWYYDIGKVSKKQIHKERIELIKKYK